MNSDACGKSADIISRVLRPATDEELATQRAAFGQQPHGPRDTYAVRDGVPAGLQFHLDDICRLEELGT